jgi:hypothetical protein
MREDVLVRRGGGNNSVSQDSWEISLNESHRTSHMESANSHVDLKRDLYFLSKMCSNLERCNGQLGLEEVRNDLKSAIVKLKRNFELDIQGRRGLGSLKIFENVSESVNFLRNNYQSKLESYNNTIEALHRHSKITDRKLSILEEEMESLNKEKDFYNRMAKEDREVGEQKIFSL